MRFNITSHAIMCTLRAMRGAVGKRIEKGHKSFFWTFLTYFSWSVDYITEASQLHEIQLSEGWVLCQKENNLSKSK